MKPALVAAVPPPQPDRVVELLERIAATLERIEARLPEPFAPDERLEQLLAATHEVVGVAEFAVVDLFEEAETNDPLRAAIGALVGPRPGGVRRLAKFIGSNKGATAGGLRFERAGRMWRISDAGNAPAPR